MDMGDLQLVSIVDPEDCKLFITICVQAYLDDWSGSVVYFPASGPPVQLISDGNRFYEVPVPWTPSTAVDPSPVAVGTNGATEANLTPLPHLPAAPMPSAAAGAGATIHFVALPPPSTGCSASANTIVVAPQTALSDDAARVQIEAYIRTSLWFRVHELESLVGESGVPLSASQLAKRGDSIWACFVKRVRRKGKLIFKCTSCGHESDRLHRAVGHQRAKWGHKPFACPDPGW
jgi:rubredoxin